MNAKAAQFAVEQLASTGFAVMSSQIAFTLRSDSWATAFDAATSFNEPAKLPKGP